MVQSHEVQHGGVKIVDMHLVLDGFIAEVIGGTDDLSPWDSTPGHPNGHGIFIMITSETLSTTTLTIIRGPAKFTAPDNQSFIKEAPLLKILDQ